MFSYNVDGQLGYVINPRVAELAATARTGRKAACPFRVSLPIRAARRLRHGGGSQISSQGQVVVAGTGELARCLQHETDHLRGKLYIDDLTGAEAPARHAVPHRPGLSPAVIHALVARPSPGGYQGRLPSKMCLTCLV